MLNLKGDLHGYIWLCFAHNTLIETKIQNFYTPKRDDKHPSPFYVWVPPGVHCVNLSYGNFLLQNC